MGIGTFGDDELTGTSAAEWFIALFGDDTVRAGDGNDTVLAGSGDDLVEGGGGDDIVLGGRGDDTIYGDDAETSGASTLGDNLIANGSFEDTTGLSPTEFGFVGDLPGWTNSGDGTPELVEDGWVDLDASDGDYWIDTGTLRSAVVDISQTVAGVENGEVYRLSFDAGHWQEPSPAPDETLNVYWNGELIATVRPDAVGSWQSFEFDVVGGSGDGSNTLRFEGVTDGSRDNQGVALDNVSLQEVIDPAGGNDYLAGGRGNDEIHGNAGDDTIVGGRGDDTMTGGADDDVFKFSVWERGEDVVTDFTSGEDVIAIAGAKYTHWIFSCYGLFGGSDPFDVLDIAQVGDDTVIDAGRTTITLENVDAATLTADDFILT